MPGVQHEVAAKKLSLTAGLKGSMCKIRTYSLFIIT